MIKAYELTALAKQKGVTDYLSYLIQTDTKFLVFAHHHSLLNAI